MKQASALLAFLSLLILRPTPALHSGGKYDSLGQEVVKVVRDNFYDQAAGQAWASAHEHYGATAMDREGFIRRTREALAELKVSHTAYYTPADPQYFGLLSIFREALEVRSAEVESIGADVTRRPLCLDTISNGLTTQAKET